MKKFIIKISLLAIIGTATFFVKNPAKFAQINNEVKIESVEETSEKIEVDIEEPKEEVAEETIVEEKQPEVKKVAPVMEKKAEPTVSEFCKPILSMTLDQYVKSKEGRYYAELRDRYGLNWADIEKVYSTQGYGEVLKQFRMDKMSAYMRYSATQVNVNVVPTYNACKNNPNFTK